MSDGGLGIAHLADIEETVGNGGSGVLYAARDLKLDRRVAVRVFDPLTDSVRREQFMQDSQVLGGLSSHPNVVTLYDAGFGAEDRPYLISELAEGDSLATVLDRRGPLPWSEAVTIALQVCAGLEQAHRSGLLHRDLRPQNVVMSGGSAKLTEFGISTGPAAGPAAHGSSEPAVIEHRAPEIYTGIWDERTDLYSLNSMLYQMIDGSSPFHRPGDDSADALRLRVLHEQPPGLDPDLAPAALGVFVVAGLAKDPFDRPQSAEEFAHELQLIREGRTTGSTPSVLHGTGSVPLVADPTVPAIAPPTRPEPASLSFSSEPALHDEPASLVASAATTQAVGQVGLAAPPMDPMDGLLFSQPAAETVSAPAGPALFVGSEPAGTMPATGLAENGQDPWASPSQGRDQAFGQPSMASDGTAVYGSFAGTDAPPPPTSGSVGPGGSNIGGDDFQPAFLPNRSIATGVAERSPVFLAAVAMVAVGLLGLAVVAAISVFNNDDETQQTAPLLPDPSQPIQAGDAVTVGTPPPTTEAPADSTTSTAEVMEESSTTETTIPRFEVPRVIGQAVEAATQRLMDDGFEVVVVSRQATAPPGIVTGQKPDPGALVTQPQTVTLFIPRVANLPAMVGRVADTVCLELQALNLTCNQVLQFNNEIPAGSVISSSPMDGQPFSEGSTVQLTVSRGPVTSVVIPDVVGQTREEAEATLTAAGFTSISFATQSSATVAADRAVGTSPAIGQTLATDQLVTVQISSGPPEMVTVPEVVGLSQADAETALSGAGFTVALVTQDLPAGDENIGKVVSADPAPGSSVPTGSTISITVGQQTPESGGG